MTTPTLHRGLATALPAARLTLATALLFLAAPLGAFADDAPAAATSATPGTSMASERTFQQDVAFLKEHADVVVLESRSGDAVVAVTPAYQGRVMTSSAQGPDGTSYGWINYKHIAAGEITPHMNAYGGEERFWLGPEGGQFSIFFPPGAEFEFEDWTTPAVIDTEPFEVVNQGSSRVDFRKQTRLKNYSGVEFDLRIDRTVEIVDARAAERSLDVSVEGLDYVGYRTTNLITNTGKQAWTRDTGLLSIWLLGMYKPGPQTTIVIPYRAGDDDELGPVVNDAYFGKVPADRLKSDEGVLFMSGDGKHRSKIGVSPRRSKGVAGSYDAARGVLTVVKYNQPRSDVTSYVNSMWELQDEPFSGDAVNAYNDGPPEPGAEPMGPFYELETSSPALELGAGESGSHISETYHFQGEPAGLDRLAREVLGVGLDQITSALD